MGRKNRLTHPKGGQGHKHCPESTSVPVEPVQPAPDTVNIDLPSTSHAAQQVDNVPYQPHVPASPPNLNLPSTSFARNLYDHVLEQPGTCTVERPQPTRASTRVAQRPRVVYASQVPTFIPNTQGVPLLPQDHPIDLAIEHRRQADNLPTTYCAARKIKGDVPTGSALRLLNHLCIHCHALLFQYEVKDQSASLCCHKGKVALQDIVVPDFLRELIEKNDHTTKEYLLNVRKYNSALAFASVQVNSVQFNRVGPYCFKINGQMYHSVGSLNAPQGQVPSYASLFIIDADEALQHRLHHSANTECSPDLMRSLQDLLQHCNPYAQLFLSVRSLAQNADDVHLHFTVDNAFDRRRFNLPTAQNEIAAVFNSVDGAPPGHFEFVIHYKADGQLSRINHLNPHCDPMCYPLLFPCGEPGFRLGLDHVEIHRTASRNTTSQLQYYCYRLAVRNGFSLLHSSGRLFQQYVVDCYVKSEGARWLYIRQHQKELRAESYQGLMDYMMSDNPDFQPSVPVILPSTFIGSPRNMVQNYQDAMSIVSRFGKPDLFITFTCNAKWTEITSNLKPYEEASNRPDLVSRVFAGKMKLLMDDLFKHLVVGISAYIFVIEFQKRGLPHVHMLLILRDSDKIREPAIVDSIVCAELPDHNEDPILYRVIAESMIHGPCGPHNLNSPGMDGDKCTKDFPKRFSDETVMNVNGHPLYQRRNDGNTVLKNIFYADNRWVVPYNKYLSKKFQAHINVEICSTIQSVKYLYNYVNKGHDCATVRLRFPNQPQNSNDEVDKFISCRYVSAPEVMWRLHERSLYDKSHTVERLPVHLYSELPENFVWKNEWKARQRRTKCVGRIFTVSPADRERFSLRLLLLHVKGPTSYDHLKTLDGTLYNTCAEAATKMNLLENDHEWIRYFEEASTFQMAEQLRDLFAVVCVRGIPVDIPLLWETFKTFLSEDYRRRYDEDTSLTMALCDIEDMLQSHGKACADFMLPTPDHQRQHPLPIINPDDEAEKGRALYASLNDQQRQVVQDNLACVDCGARQCFFVDGPGGTGKTYLYKTLIHTLRGQGKTVLSVAWTGITAKPLIDGKTAHSAFKFPVPLLDTSVSSMRQNSNDADAIRKVSLIIWDEVSMVNKEALIVLDTLLRDLTGVDASFEGKIIVFGGDFRQVLPVVRRGNRTTIVEACVKKTHLWSDVLRRRRSVNMRAANDHDFSDWLLKLGDGTLPIESDLSPESISIPKHCYCQPDILISETFGNTIFTNKNIDQFFGTAILCPKNEDCEKINDHIVNTLLPGNSKTYLSFDTVQSQDPEDAQLYPTDK